MGTLKEGVAYEATSFFYEFLGMLSGSETTIW
jgi:hypothetical protein